MCPNYIVQLRLLSFHLSGKKSCYLVLSPVILLFVKTCLSVFPFDDWDKLWVLIRSFPEVSLHINFHGAYLFSFSQTVNGTHSTKNKKGLQKIML